MSDWTEQELAEIEAPILEELPPDYVAPKLERDPKGRLLPGHSGLKKPKPKPVSDSQLKRLAKQELTFLTHHEEVALKREAIHSVIGEYEMKKAIVDLYEAALAAENPYAKVALMRLFFEQTVGMPPKQLEVQSTQYQYKQSIDYSKLTKDELAQLEKLASKFAPTEGNAL
jgi:hypothetical protein